MAGVKSIGFLGGGRVVRFLVEGLQKANSLPGEVLVTEPDKTALDKLRKLCSSVREASSDEALKAEVAFLALHPPALSQALSELQGKVGQATLVVSLAPKITLSQISSKLNSKKVVRMIPNAPSLIGRGYNPVSFSQELSDQEKQKFIDLAKSWGDVIEVSEDKLEAYAVVSAMGPTYFWPLIQALRETATTIGLQKEEADRAIDKTLWGTVSTLISSGLSFEEVCDLIPVKPLSEEVDQLAKVMKERLPQLHAKIKP